MEIAPPPTIITLSYLLLRGDDTTDHSMYGEPPSEERITEMQENWLIPAGKLTVQSELGRGAFGVVYKGKYLTTTVAVKKLHQHNDDIAKDFLHEVQIMKNLRHPNIVLWMGVQHDTEKGELSIVTEFVPNGTLSTFLKNKKSSWSTRVSMALEIANALGYLHDRRILHRDLKSENVLLGASLECKVADFGLAVLHKGGARLSAVGDPWWRAPEVDNYEYDERADIFSYGIVLGEIITRFDGEHIRLGMVYQKSKKLEFGVDSSKLSEMVTETAPDCPPALMDLAIACCREDPSARPSLAQVVERLDKLNKELKRLTKELDSQTISKEGRDLFLSLCTGSFTEVDKCTVKTQDILDAVAKQIKDETERVLNDDELANIASMIPNGGGECVTLSQFTSFWAWYSAIYKLITDPRLHGLWRVGFIHGFASRQQVEELLETLNEPHTVIFRFSSTQVDSLVISYLARQDEKTRHDLIKVSEGGFSTKNEHIRSSLKKVLRDTEEEYKDLEFIYPHIPFAKAVFYTQLNAEPTDDMSEIGYNVRT